MNYDEYRYFLEAEEKAEQEFIKTFNSMRGGIEDRLFLVGANCFSRQRLTFINLEEFQEILSAEDMLSLIRFKNKIFRNNQCLGYADNIISPFSPNPNTLNYSYFIKLNEQNNLYEFCQIYYSIFQKFSDSKLKKSEQTVSSFGKLHDYRNALNHNPIDRSGWLYKKGTTLEKINLTQQEAIDELFDMLRIANIK